jgi:hypothetical protein
MLADLSLRPSRPQPCRKRRLCQGQALPGRCAGRDIRRRASGLKLRRAMDEDASGGGSEQRYIIQDKRQNAQSKRHTGIFLFSGIFFLPTSGDSYTGSFIAPSHHHTDTGCVFSVSAMSADGSPYAPASPRRHVRHDDHVSRSTPARHTPHVNPAHSEYELTPLLILLRHRHHAYSPSSRYRLTASRIHTRRFPHADTMRIRFRANVRPFVLRCPRGPAYVLCTRYTSRPARGCRPFEPRQS